MSNPAEETMPEEELEVVTQEETENTENAVEEEPESESAEPDAEGKVPVNSIF